MTKRTGILLVSRADLDSPPTDDERAWWREVAKRERRRTVRFWAPYYFGLFIIPTIVRHPAAFFAGQWMTLVPSGMVAAFVAAVGYWSWTSSYHFRKQLAAKRTRDALLGGGTSLVDHSTT